MTSASIIMPSANEARSTGGPLAYPPPTWHGFPTARARAVRLMIFDIDGVMTDGGLHYTDAGSEVKTFHARDGLGIKLLHQSGVMLAIITGRNTPLVDVRAVELGITHLYKGVKDKLIALRDLQAATGLTDADCGYMGDDIIDLPILRRAALAVSVPDAHPLALDAAHYITHAAAGHGAVREVCEAILHAQGNWEAQLAPYQV